MTLFKPKHISLSIGILVTLLILLPLFYLLIYAIPDGKQVTSDGFSNIFSAGILKSIFNSVTISAFVSTFSVIIGSCFAFLFSKTRLPLKNLFKFLILLPLLLPPYIFAVAWTDTWFYFGLDRDLIYSPFSVIFIMISVYTPLAAFIIEGSLNNISSSIEEAGVTMTSYTNVMLKVIIPLIRPALLSSFIVIFVLTISEFSVPFYLSVKVFPTEIFLQFTAFYNYSSAIVQALILTLICLLLIFPERIFLAGTPFISMGGRSLRFKSILHKTDFKYIILCLAYILLFVLTPFISLIIQSIGKSGEPSILYTIKQLSPSLWDSLLISFAGSFVVTLSGFIFAVLSVRYRIKIAGYFLLFVFAVPAIVIGIALVKFYNTSLFNFIYGSSLIILIAFIARYAFISQKIFTNGLLQIPESFQEAAKLTGASHFYTFRKITMPLLGESFYISFFIIMIFCVSELTSVIMIYPPGISLLPVRIFTLMANAPQSTISRMCLIALGFSLGLILIMISGRKILFSQKWRSNQ